MSTARTTPRRSVVAMLCLLLLIACTSDSRPGTAASASSASGVGSLDVHQVEWTTMTAPGAACQSDQPIHLHNEGPVGDRPYGTALIPDEQHGYPDPPGAASGPRYDRLIYSGAVTYGDFTGDGHDDALVSLNCNNNGGTAAGALLYSLVAYTGGTGTLEYVGLITPRQQPPDERPGLPNATGVRPGTIDVEEDWYGPNDPDCCPSGRAMTTWVYADGQIHPGSMKVTAEPTSS